MVSNVTSPVEGKQVAGRPRVLFIVPISPWPSQGGGELRTARFAQAAAKIADVKVLSLYSMNSPQAPDTLKEVVIRPGAPAHIWSYRNGNKPLAPILPKPLFNRINRHVSEFSPDIIFFEQTITTGVLPDLQTGNARIIFNTQNFDSDLLKTEHELRYGMIDREVLKRALAEERFAARAADKVVCCSELDASRFRDEAGIEPIVISNPLPDEAALSIPLSPDRYQNSEIVFVGSMMYFPNRQAVDSLMKIFGTRDSRRVKIRLVGRNADNLPKRILDSTQVSIVSDPPVVLPHLSDVGFTVMPIRQGGGTRLKVLEAMAAGLVVIATEKAVEGLGLVQNEHYIRAETDTDFRREYLSLRQKPDECRQLAERARQFVRDHFSNDRLDEKIRLLIS